jgi:hypothetical protein
MKRWFLSPALALAMAAALHADPQSVSDPSKEFPITADAGTWVIVAASYTGPHAAELAHQLVSYLRSQKIPAYVNYNHADQKRAELEAAKQRWKQQYPDVPFRGERLEADQYVDQFSVLIGGFQDVKSASDYMNKVLKDPKTPLPPLKLADGTSAYDRVFKSEREDPDNPNSKVVIRGIDSSPYARSFVTRNPALGSVKTADPFLITLNAEEEYSLLKNPAPWTIFVKSYNAGATYVSTTQKTPEPSFISRIWGNDRPSGEVLNAAAMQAHETADVLRKLGFEAYVLHTRHNSIVTIGGFNDKADPAMLKVVEELAARLNNPASKLDVLHLPRDFRSCEVPRP